MVGPIYVTAVNLLISLPLAALACYVLRELWRTPAATEHGNWHRFV